MIGIFQFIIAGHAPTINTSNWTKLKMFLYMRKLSKLAIKLVYQNKKFHKYIAHKKLIYNFSDRPSLEASRQAKLLICHFCEQNNSPNFDNEGKVTPQPDILIRDAAWDFISNRRPPTNF